MTERMSPTEDWQQRQQEQAAGFDVIGSRYDEVFPHKDGQVQAVEQLLTHLPSGAHVLDVGCGTGIPTARQLVDAGCVVTGIDISPVMLDLARRNVPEVTYLRRDAVDVDGTLGQFDAVVAFFSLLMLPRPEIVTTLGRIADLLTPAGWLALGMVEADFDDLELPFLGLPLRVTAWPRNQLRTVVEGVGFEVHAQDVRAYEPPAPGVPPEIQLFLLGKRI